ncbi:MAG: sulfatase-like hydrolase/transferase [Eubacteriales bacterium]|nr:sulfatase-like hydrolase/transferase [Eubacteriales bacterium]
MFERMINPISNKWSGIRNEYGILALAAIIAVPLKVFLFYDIVGVQVNFFFVWLITCILIYLLFAAFRQKWTPAVIYTLFSILMLCDVTYGSFFNRYLSVNMLGAAGVLGDITESIKEVLKPSFFLMLADALLILAALSVRFHRLRKGMLEEGIKKNIRVTSPVIALIIILLLVFNFFGNNCITSISNQEIFSYHIKDIIVALTGHKINNGASEYMATIKDTYQTEKNGPLFGVAEGRNLIVIQIESFQNFVVNTEYNGQEITPNLNEIIKGDTVYFDRYYQQVGSGNTSDSELATNNSIYGSLSSYSYKLFADNYYRGLPVLLSEKGYETAVFHAHEERDFWNREEAYQSLGFDTFYGGIGGSDIGQYDMTEWMGWGLTDTAFFDQSMKYLKELTEPFYSFFITLSNHHPYLMLDHYQFIDLLPEDEGTIFGNYINSAAYTDHAIGQFIQQLKDEGLYENSIIALYGDHLGLPKNDEDIFKSVSLFLGKDYDFDTMMNIPLIITVPGADREINQTVSIPGGQIDFLPTIAYLMGFETLDTIYLGHNLLTIDTGFVAEQTYMTKGSFFQDDIVYEMSRDGVFKNGRAWNQRTGTTVPAEDCYEGYMRSMGIINTSEFILKNDVLRKIYEKNQYISDVFSSTHVIDYPYEIAVAGAPDKELIGTNSLEALNASYDAGHRDIKIGICWTEDEEAVLLSAWKELGKYYDTNLSDKITLDGFHSLTMKNRLTPMDFLDLIVWARERPDVTLIVQTESSADYFMKCMSSYSEKIMGQFVLEIPGMVEYTGLYPSILNIEKGGNTADQLIEFIRLNNVAAVSMSKKSADGVYRDILKADCISYVSDDENGIITKIN